MHIWPGRQAVSQSLNRNQHSLAHLPGICTTARQIALVSVLDSLPVGMHGAHMQAVAVTASESE
jgi:hypothetical protein